MQKNNFDVLVIGAGPAGLSAAISASAEGKSVLLLEREARIGGILKQCIHDGFGLLRFGKRMSGCEYAQIFINELKRTSVVVETFAFVTRIEKKPSGEFDAAYTTSEGLKTVSAKAVVLSTGCRERSARQVSIHGTRPAGLMTAGAAQYYTNILGYLPTKKCVILGSGDIGLIMARRLTLEGAKVLGVYEAKRSPSGLRRNISQCLDDFNIPLYCSKTVSRVFGEARLCAVEICDVDENMALIPQTQEVIECDALILSVGLIPENEIAESLGVLMDPATKGPVTNEFQMTSVPGVFVCGNAWQVSDLADYVSESGERAGKNAANYVQGEKSSLCTLEYSSDFLYMVPQCFSPGSKVVFYFRAKEDMGKTKLSLFVGDKEVFSKIYPYLRVTEMQRLELETSKFEPCDGLKIAFSLQEVIE